VTVRSTLEVSAAGLTAALHFVFYEILPGRGAFIVVTILAWLIYVASRIRREPSSLHEFGLSKRGLRGSSVASAVVLIVGASFCILVGLGRATLRFTPDMLILALLYPLWGLEQQLLVQGMVVRNLVPRFSTAAVAAVAGVLFGLVHLPHLALAIATAVVGAVFALIFLRWRNIWALGVCHGWLGVFFYFWVLGRDPWLQIVAGA
jgi:hypothetical protein